MASFITFISLSIIFTFLGLIHINWSFGGTWALDKSLPSLENGKRILNPKKYHSAIVGIGLLGMALFYLHKSELILIPAPEWIFEYGRWIIPGIFVLRAIGDFKYVGFFRQVNNTLFAKADAQLFSPLCLGIGIAALLMEFI